MLVATGSAATAIGLAERDGGRGRVELPSSDASLPSLPAPPASALVVPAPRALPRYRESAQIATVLRPAFVRDRLGPKAAVVARLETRTPEGTSNLVPVVGRAKDRTGALWVRVRLPARSSDAAGWVPRHALGVYRILRTRLEIDLDRFTARLLDGGREVFRARVGIGKPASPTPRGSFYVRSKLTGYSSPFYGPLAFGTSARSSVLTDWPAGGYVGIHGTSRPELLPGRVSHGCIRMRNADIVRLARLMPVGTPVTIR